MGLMYKALGWVAYANERMSRSSVNFVPFNWIVTFVCAICAMHGTFTVIAAQVNGPHYRGENPFLMALVAFAGWVGLILLTATFAMRYVVFQKSEPGSSASSQGSLHDEAEAAIGFTGHLRLDEHTAQRFLNVPTVAERAKSGEIAFLSNINATSSFYSIVLKHRVGTWYSLVRAQSVTSAERGVLHLGSQSLPALRLRYTDGSGGKPVQSVLSFPNERARDAMLSQLS